MADQKPTASGPSTIPLSEGLVKAVLANFCEAPINGDDTWEHCSIGVDQNSIVATDTNSAILIGEVRELHVATDLKELKIELERSKQYGDPVRLDDLPRNTDDKTGASKPMPHVQGMILQSLEGMTLIGTVHPSALVSVGAVAAKAGAIGVDLYQPAGEVDVLGFRFRFLPKTNHVNLFTRWDGDIKAMGIFKTTKGALSVEEVKPTLPEGAEVPAAPTRKPKSKKPDSVVVDLSEEQTEDKGSSPEIPQRPPVDPQEIRMVDSYRLPPLATLEQPEITSVETGDYGNDILDLLRARNIPGRIVDVQTGPTITTYELSIPPGISVKKISSLGEDIQMQLAVSGVLIEAPIPGKSAIGIQIPNKKARMVSLSEVCSSHAFLESEKPLLVALGLDIAGSPVYMDLATTPHLLVGGATNSGKSVGLATIICSLLLRNAPSQLRFVMIDPKRVELTLFDGIPHLMCPVIKDVKEAAGVLRAVWREMDRRYDLCSEAGVRNITGYNAKQSFNERLPYIVVIIDELADLMIQCGQEVETVIVRLAQLARAVGIHLVVATQRPSADIVTGLIKANVPSRIAFAVASGIDSSVILDQRGAEKLLGRGDMLFKPIDGGGKARRIQSAYVSESEVDAICRYWREQRTPDYTISLFTEETVDEEEEEEDDLYVKAVTFAVERKQISTSMLQRKFSIGFQRSSKLIDRMEARKVVGPRDGPRPREVLISEVPV